MPIVHVYMLRGRNAEQKHLLVSALTRAMVDAAGAEPERVYVVLDEVEPENWARGGVPLAVAELGGDGAAT